MFGFLRRKKKPVTEAQPVAHPVAGEAGREHPQPAPAEQAQTPMTLVELMADTLSPATETAPATPDDKPVVAADKPPASADTTNPDLADTARTAETETEAVAVVTAPADRRGWMSRLRSGLSRTRSNISGIFTGARLDDALYEELETALLMSDAGYETTTAVLTELKARVRKQRIETSEAAREALGAILADLLRPLEQPLDIDRAEPLVMMIAGVNGAGKTTSIGKLAHHLQREGKSILLAAGDTFRAAAREQLAEWGARNDVRVIAQQGGDPAAVAFDAVTAGRARRTGVVMVDTAGRLPTQAHLMEELRKIRRVLDKAMPGSPHETLLVLDGNTGQNMLAQVQAFDAVVPLTGLIVTKLDGTAKGGALVALAQQRRESPIPVYFVGVGESIDDLQAFSADEFAHALIG